MEARGVRVLVGLMGLVILLGLVWTVSLSSGEVLENISDSADGDAVALGASAEDEQGGAEGLLDRGNAGITFFGSVVIHGGFVVKRKSLEFGLADGRSVTVAIDTEGRFEFSVIDPGDALEVSVPFLSGHPAIEIDIAGTKHPSHDLGTIVLGEGMSGVIIEAHGIQTLDVSEFWAGLWTLENGRTDELITSGKIEHPEDDEQVILEVPPQARYRTHMGVGNVFPEFAESGHEEPMLGFLEWRLHTIDLRGIVPINPRLIEIPRTAMKGQAVFLRQPGNGKVSKLRSRICMTDAEGRIKIVDRFDGKNQFTAFIQTFDLKEVRLLGEGRTEVIDENTRTLAPIHRIVGLVRLDAEGEPEMLAKWALDCSPSSTGGVGSFMLGVQLVAEQLLDDASSEFSFRTPGGRRYPFTRADLFEIEPGLFGIPIVAKAAKSRLVVTSASAAPDYLELALMEAGTKGYSGLVRRGSLSSAGEEHVWVLEGLEAGEYDLNWMWKREEGWILGKAVEGVIILGEEEESEASVKPPEVRLLNGYFQNWLAIPEVDRPRRVRFGGRTSSVDKEGHFETALLTPVPESGDARLARRWLFSDAIVEVVKVGPDDSLAVALKLNEIIRVLVSVDSDRLSDELGIECWVMERGVQEELQSSWRSERPQLRPDGTALISTSRDKIVVGSIWEFVYGLGTPSVLGFFEVDPMQSSVVHVELEGRPVHVELKQLSDKNTTNITVIWRSPSGMTVRCPVRWLANQDAPAFWCPDTEVDIEFERDGAIQKISEWTGDRIVLGEW